MRLLPVAPGSDDRGKIVIVAVVPPAKIKPATLYPIFHFAIGH
jgi:hypothetical protein